MSDLGICLGEPSGARALIIGYGNPLRGDDGVGWYVATELESLLAAEVAGGLVEVLTLHQLTPEFADTVSEAELVMFVDACCDREPGVVCRQQVEPSDVVSTDGMTHQLDPSTLLGYAKSIFGTSPEALLYTIGGKSFEFEEAISYPVRRAAEFVVEDIRELIAGIARKQKPRMENLLHF